MGDENKRKELSTVDRLNILDKTFAIKDIDFKDRVLTINELHDWVNLAPGEFHISAIASDVGMQMRHVQQLDKMVKMGLIEHVGKRRGWYRPIENELEEMDFKTVLAIPVDIWLPFELSEKVEIYEGNVIIIAGVWNAGKTAIVLNMVKENRDRFNVHYFNSEMGAAELKKRLDLFSDITINNWNFNAYRRAEKFADVIRPGPNNLNIIDFLEVHDEFYVIGKRIKEIHDKLKGAIAVICLQKNPGVEAGLGGSRSMEIARLVIALDSGRVKITKAKNYRGKENPNGLIKNFKLVNGCQIIDRFGWQREE